MPTPLEYSADGEDPVVLKVRGEVDMATSPSLAAAIAGLLQHGHKNVALDLEGIAFMDSSGVNALVGSHNRLKNVRGSLVVQSAASPVRRVLQLTGLESLLASSE